MKTCTALCFSLLVVASSQAAEPLLAPVISGGLHSQPDFYPYHEVSNGYVESQGQPSPLMPIPEEHALPSGQFIPPPSIHRGGGAPIGLYPFVQVTGTKRIHPLAVPQIVSVPSPCPHSCEPVYVEVCMPIDPPCEIKVDRQGRRITYYYGSHRVRIVSINDKVRVKYYN